MYERPGTSASARETPSRSSPATAASHSATRCSTPGSPSASLCGGVWTGSSSTRSSPSCAHASCAQTRWPMCGGLNVPPSRPMRATQGRIWPSPSTRYLNVHSSRSADRPAGVQLLGRVADLGAHPELAAVGEARRGVDVHAGGVDAELERPRGRGVARDDRLGVAGAVGVDVLDRLLGGADDLHREHEREELLRPVGLGRPRRRSRRSPRTASSPRSSTPAARSEPSTRGRNSAGDGLVHEQRLGGVADARALGLGVEHDRLGALEVGARVDEDVAVARRRVDHRAPSRRRSAPSSGPRRRAG